MKGEDDPFERLKNLPPRGHHALLGIYNVDDGPDWAELACPFAPGFLMDAGAGLVSSGPVVSLIDAATGAAIIARTRQWRPMATLDLRVDYLRSARAGSTLHARAACYHVTRKVAFTRCDVHDGDAGDPVAHATATFFFTGDA
ncbi:PaaI family thioesterase [Novosphingobium sp. PP1Y]|uniref:PaaI family thioesterase n=1 Tax=Novosphingobium sp. PP1Y TaxID=702113 RepID=UPI00020EF8C5|nr:PaaI family thioesterase [Novosphingobium sp. PP1Y]CCA90224.1 thioesterase superfamily protein [Novosphingobium sp. PP1Y]